MNHQFLLLHIFSCGILSHYLHTANKYNFFCSKIIGTDSTLENAVYTNQKVKLI
jgi:hypothetical protein